MDDTRWLDDREDRAWRGYELMRLRLTSQLHRGLVDQTGLSLTDYMVLVVLSETTEDLIRANELGAELQWEKSRLSHHLTRMEKRGLIERQPCETDARGQFVVLTPVGRKAIEASAPFHVEDVRRFFVDLLTDEELEVMARISGKVLTRLEAEETTP